MLFFVRAQVPTSDVFDLDIAFGIFILNKFQNYGLFFGMNIPITNITIRFVCEFIDYRYRVLN